jgi:hypothetical protein
VFLGVIVDPILVTAQEAALWTGRPVGTIWRWGTERRITVHRGRTPKDTRYDLRELPAATDDGPAAAPKIRESVAA